MKLEYFAERRHKPRQKAFSLVETLMATMVSAIAFTSLYAGFTAGFQAIQNGRENLRATQVILEKFETIRLYSWDQINTSGFIPTTFTAPFNPTPNASGGFTYTGTVSFASAPVSESYSNDLKQVSITLTWSSSKSSHSRSMTTLVSRYGLQNYIYY